MKCNIPLEATIFVMKMICALNAVLFLSSQAKLAASAHAAGETNTYKTPELDIITKLVVYPYLAVTIFIAT